MPKINSFQCFGEAWEKARMRALVRDDFTCQAHKLGIISEPCGETRLRKLHVHHILPRSCGGTHDLDNLITVCVRCHERIHPHMRFDLSAGKKQFELPPKEL